MAVEKIYGQLPEKTSLFYLKEGKMLENVIKTDNLERVKAKLDHVTQSILAEDFEARPEKGACYNCAFKSICDFVEND
jgi:CRISPR/Cas system-associated exonuclease Cas4 (RecB family)